jgi:protein-S-isoprenylcysteine O-methyltransferase Ste14
LASVLFRLRVAVIVLLHIIGFFAPWNYWTGGSHGTLWLTASSLLARTGVLGLSAASLTVTLAGLACLVAGTVLRVWGTAYLTPGVMRGATMMGDRLVAAGPYTHLRNPLYLGIWFLSLTTSLLMPPDGAVFFLVAISAFLLLLIRGEETYLANQLGEPYLQYRRDVPRLLPRLASHTEATPLRPDWLRAFLNEIYPIGFTACFAALAWRYNARILVKCLLISSGMSLVVRAVIGNRR